MIDYAEYLIAARAALARAEQAAALHDWYMAGWEGAKARAQIEHLVMWFDMMAEQVRAERADEQKYLDNLGGQP